MVYGHSLTCCDSSKEPVWPCGKAGTRLVEASRWTTVWFGFSAPLSSRLMVYGHLCCDFACRSQSSKHQNGLHLDPPSGRAILVAAVFKHLTVALCHSFWDLHCHQYLSRDSLALTLSLLCAVSWKQPIVIFWNPYVKLAGESFFVFLFVLKHTVMKVDLLKNQKIHCWQVSVCIFQKSETEWLLAS